jgi:hypothetical protein
MSTATSRVENRTAKVAAVTMTYNEPDFLPIWARHYSAQVGPKHCYVIDHGSDDGSCDALEGTNVVAIPRSPYDDERNARFISGFCSSLLEWYDFVLHADVDEFLAADPARYSSLANYCASCDHDVVTAMGFNIVHTSDDSAVDTTATILEQRKWMCFSAALSKPALTRRPLVWNPGFHRIDDVEPRFDDLYLFHLRFFDQNVGLRRLEKTRSQPWADPEACWWQRIPDDDCLQMFARYDNRAKNAEIEVSKDSPAVLEAISQTLGSSGGRIGEPDTFDLHYEGAHLWPIPERFRPLF